MTVQEKQTSTEIISRYTTDIQNGIEVLYNIKKLQKEHVGVNAN